MISRERCRQQAVVATDFLFGLRNPHDRGFPRLDQTGIAKEESFMGDDFAGVWILQGLAGPENIPFFDAGIRHAGNKGNVAIAEEIRGLPESQRCGWGSRLHPAR